MLLSGLGSASAAFGDDTPVLTIHMPGPISPRGSYGTNFQPSVYLTTLQQSTIGRQGETHRLPEKHIPVEALSKIRLSSLEVVFHATLVSFTKIFGE